MSVNPEQPVLDEIDALVNWQIEEGEKRGDHLSEAAISFRIPSREELDEFLARQEELQRARAVVVPPDAPYQEHRKFEPGERVGWQNADGRVYIGVVESHVEDPPESGNWTMALVDDRPPSRAAEMLEGMIHACEELLPGNSSSSV